MGSLNRFLLIRNWLILILFFLGILCTSSCNDNLGKQQDNTLAKGKSLSEKYCQSCHLVPDPSMATKVNWVDQILPNMGPRLGIYGFREKKYPSSKNSPYIHKGFYPENPQMSEEDWAALVYYFGYSAPDTLAAQKRDKPISLNNSVFRAQSPPDRSQNPLSTYIAIDSSRKQIIQADGLLGYLYIYDEKLKLNDSIKIGSMVVDAYRKDEKLIICDVGMINPNDGRFGKIWETSSGNHDSKRPGLRLLTDSLRRPVQMIPADLNGDGKQDIVICEFGNLLGAFSWLENRGNGEYIRHVLREIPGAIHAIIQDYNHDGLPDIWVLFAQGNEEIALFINKGNGQFEAHDIIRFPAIFGSTYFELKDFNGDGYTDILYAAGDNGDYSQVLKPYHGIYIFLNDGHQHFHKKFFFPMHGCFKVMARDFDGDGDLDIAAISYFADYASQPEEGFVYLENKGNWNFEASTLPETQKGRWLTMDAGDLDGDGRIDLVLGNFSVGPTPIPPKTDWKKGPPFLFLKNITKDSGIHKSPAP